MFSRSPSTVDPVMDESGTRLEQALMLYMAWKGEGSGTDAETFLADNEEYRDLLEPMLEDTSPTLEPEGKRLGEYRILEEIGRGGMGVVYLAVQAGLARKVALKVLPAHLTLDQTTVLRFQREARMAARLEHPGIVAVHGVGKDEDAYYFAMDYVQGIPLSQKIKEALRLREAGADKDSTGTQFGSKKWIEEGVGRIAQVADAMQHAHEQGILHRDVKPSNIIIREDGTPVLTDFGLAREQGLPSMTMTGDFAGTPFYVSPEQGEGRTDLDARTDVFSLGVTLYEVLTLHRPFDGETPREVIHKILDMDPTDPRRFGVDLPPDLRAIIAQALEKDRGLRYSSAGEMARDLRAFLEYKPVSARRATTGRRIVRWSKRNPVVAALSGALILSLVVGFVLVLDRNQTLSRSLAETQLLLDARVVEDYANTFLELEAWKPEHAPAIRRWIRDVEKISARQASYRALLESRKAAPREGDEVLIQSLERLNRSLEQMTRKQSGKLAVVHGWLESVETVEQRSLVQHAGEWKAAIADIARPDSPYRGLRLSPQIGLVPIGKDEHSGLWEFSHVQTGKIAERDPQGRIVMGEKTGLVFVLLPGGRFEMGSIPPGDTAKEGEPYVDSMAASWEFPLTEIELAPFFLSKYEMTQGQWLRITGENPSYFRPGVPVGNAARRLWTSDLRHPVEMIHWVRATEVTKVLGLRLPSEPQWEYAARGGTTTRWWTGDAMASLRGAENLADQALAEHLNQRNRLQVAMDYDDGHARHAPVGSFRANPFGFHDMLGNLAEFTSDRLSNYKTPPRKGDGARESRPGADIVLRGAGFLWPPQEARCAYRDTLDQWSPANAVGFRPARALR